jgi:Leucine-rich repeat (LRR) protein
LKLLTRLDSTSPEGTVAARLLLRSDSKEERAERKAWPSKLREFTNLKCLWVNGCTPELFESIGHLRSLLRLSIVRGRVPTLDGLNHLAALTHFYYCGSPKLATLHPIGEASSLIGLTLVGNFENVPSLEPLGSLSRLESLCLGANDFCQNSYESFAPIGKLRKLRHLAIISTKVSRGGLFPLGELQNLEYLSVSPGQLKFWSIQEYQHLYEALPKLKTNLIELAATDREFQKKHKIR